MPPRLKLSSSLTFVSEWIFPVGMLVGTIAHINIALHDPEYPMAVAILWSVGFIFVLVISSSIKLVSIEGDYFVISNYFTSRRAPIAHLARVSKSYITRGPTILLHFDPPSPFGKRVRIIPGWNFDELMALLQSLISKSERP